MKSGSAELGNHTICLGKSRPICMQVVDNDTAPISAAWLSGGMRSTECRLVFTEWRLQIDCFLPRGILQPPSGNESVTETYDSVHYESPQGRESACVTLLTDGNGLLL